MTYTYAYIYISTYKCYKHAYLFICRHLIWTYWLTFFFLDEAIHIYFLRKNICFFNVSYHIEVDNYLYWTWFLNQCNYIYIYIYIFQSGFTHCPFCPDGKSSFSFTRWHIVFHRITIYHNIYIYIYIYIYILYIYIYIPVRIFTLFVLSRW